MELSKSTFSQIIRATASGVDWEEFGVAVATADPSLFVTVLNSLDVGWKAEAIAMGDNGETYVTVVKYVREAAKFGLKDAKEWVDANVPSTKVFNDEASPNTATI